MIRYKQLTDNNYHELILVIDKKVCDSSCLFVVKYS